MLNYRCASFWTHQATIGRGYSLLIKIKTQWSTWNIPWKFCVWWTMRTSIGMSLCLEEPVQLKSHSYWNHSVSLIPSMTTEKHATITASACKQNWKQGDAKINFASFIPLQMTKFQKFWVPEYFLYQCTLLIKIQTKGSTVIFTSKFSFGV